MNTALEFVVVAGRTSGSCAKVYGPMTAEDAAHAAMHLTTFNFQVSVAKLTDPRSPSSEIAPDMPTRPLSDEERIAMLETNVRVLSHRLDFGNAVRDQMNAKSDVRAMVQDAEPTYAGKPIREIDPRYTAKPKKPRRKAAKKKR